MAVMAEMGVPGKMLTNREYKEKFIEALMSRDSSYTKQKSSVQYVTRCPFCGDSHNVNTGHFYLKIDLEDNSPIVYNCFRCPASGSVNNDVLNQLGIFDSDLQNQNKSFNKNTDKFDRKRINGGVTITNFDFKLPHPKLGPKTDYICNRLGRNFTIEELTDMKVVTSLRDFLKYNNINTLSCPDKYAYIFEKDFIGFLTYGNSHILFRDITGKYDKPWIKYPITEKSKENKIFYSIPSDIDIFTDEIITINLTEGVFDILSIYGNLGYNKPNTINIAVTGKYYESIIYYLMDIGLIGYNVIINIFSDNDKDFNKKNRGDDTTEEFFKEKFKYIKYLFKSVNIYYNMLYKDCGTSIENIKLRKIKL